MASGALLADCLSLLRALGIDRDTVAKGARRARFHKGIGNNTPMSELYSSSSNPTLARLVSTVTGTVGDRMVANPGIQAIAQIGRAEHLLKPTRDQPI